MSWKFLVVIITACVLGGAIGGLVVVWVKDAPVAAAQEPAPRPRANSHYIKPGHVDRI